MGMMLRRHSITPIKAEKQAKVETPKPAVSVVEEKVDVVEEVVEEVKATTYTRTEINRMSTAKLQEVATENGFKNADKFSGSQLKKMLINKFDV